MPLSLQDKLALALTSAGSQRALAKLVGVSHQRIGRWLREGEPSVIDPETGYLISSAGAKSIPKDFAPLIDQAFEIHKDISRWQARVDKLPFDPNAPTFAYRGIMRNGQKGEQVIVERTKYIKPELRTDILEKQARSNKYLQASVRSTVNLKSYFKRVAADEIKKYNRKRTTPAKLGKQIMDGFLNRANKIVSNDELMPLFTRYENISPGTNSVKSVAAINRKLREKHEAHATELANEFLFQLIPEKRSRATDGKQKTKPTSNKPRKR